MEKAPLWQWTSWCSYRSQSSQWNKGLSFHQHEYIQTKLANRAVSKGRPSLPEVDEGSICPVTQEYKRTEAYENLLNIAQQE
eukprot:10091931-Lingulodinium_polyedra.AAC.1